MEPVNEEMSLETAYDLVRDNETAYFMYSKEEILEMAKHIKEQGDENKNN